MTDDRLPYVRPCSVCRGVCESYEVTDEVWNAAGCKEGSKCLSCLEDKLGRDINIEDFTDSLINFGLFKFDCRKWLKERMR